MLSSVLYGKWIKLNSIVFILFTIMHFQSNFCFAEATTKKYQLTSEFSQLLTQLDTIKTPEEQIAFLENALSSGLPHREEVGMIYAMKGTAYLEMAIQQINKADTTNRNLDVEMHIKSLLLESFKDYNMAIAIQPNFFHHFWSRGYLYELMGDLDKALDDYNISLELEKDNAEAYLGRARVLAEQKKCQQAINDIEKAMILDPEIRKPSLQNCTY